MKRLLVGSLIATCALLNVVHADPIKSTINPSEGGSINEDMTPAPLMTPKLLRIFVDSDPSDAALPAVNSNLIYMNRCIGGCPVSRSGSSNSTLTPDRSNIICLSSQCNGGPTSGTLSQFSVSDTTWTNVMQCVRETFAPFDIQITDVDPGSAPHYEIMHGGTPGELGFEANVGGVSPSSQCGQLPNSVVFVFDVWGSSVNDICRVAAQEISHSWGLDHVIEPDDPMSYFDNGGARRHFTNAEVPCGSDCFQGSANGIPCGGPGNQTRQCICGAQTQNSVAMIGALFGAGTPTPPTVSIVNPPDGAIVTAAFPIGVMASDNEGISKVELRIDGTLTAMLATGPFGFNAPASLGGGSHTVEVTAYDIFNASTKASITVSIGPPCTDDSGCSVATDVCVGGRCVAGPNAPDGLGTECTSSGDCASHQCAMSTDGSFCVEQCAIGGGQCPSGFGCLDTGAGTGQGVCFPGVDEGGGCSSSGGPVGLGVIGFAAMLVFRRRKRA